MHVTGEEARAHTAPQLAAHAAKPAGFFGRMRDSDIVASFLRSKTTVVATIIVVVMGLAALFAPLIAPTNPFDPAQVFLMNASLPPSWLPGGDPQFVIGTDDQGRDLYSAILYGLRVSLAVGLTGVAIAATLGITLGLVAGYFGGRIDAIIMRVADVQLTFPAILIALLIDGVVHALLKGTSREDTAFTVLAISIGLSFWVQYARTIRGSTLVERNKDYVQAARLVGLPAPLIMLRHVLPNVIGPVLVLSLIHISPAQFRLGNIFEKGHAGPRDPLLARIWYERAAERGNVRAMHNLAVIHADGGGQQPDYVGAVRWFERAAGFGVSDSQYNLAILKARGLGTERDLPGSFRWFAAAAAQGDQDAARKRDEVAARLSPTELAAATDAMEKFKPLPTDRLANEVVLPEKGFEDSAASKAQKRARS